MSKKSAAKKAATVAIAQAQRPAPNLPLFFKKPAVVDSKRHATAHLSTMGDLSFARDTNSVPVNAIEFIEAAKSYPIVFTPEGDSVMPVAIVGWEKKNYFAEGRKWSEGHYVPAYVRQYPFIFFQSPKDQKFYLCVDESSSQYHAKKTSGAQPLYDKGEPSALSKRALEFCTSFYQHMNITRNLCNDLQKHKLLQPYSSQAKLPNGKQLQIGGFRMIDEKAFNALPQEVFLEFRKKGWLAFIYLALASTSNWKRLIELAQAKK